MVSKRLTVFVIFAALLLTLACLTEALPHKPKKGVKHANTPLTGGGGGGGLDTNGNQTLANGITTPTNSNTTLPAGNNTTITPTNNSTIPSNNNSTSIPTTNSTTNANTTVPANPSNPSANKTTNPNTPGNNGAKGSGGKGSGTNSGGNAQQTVETVIVDDNGNGTSSSNQTSPASSILAKSGKNGLLTGLLTTLPMVIIGSVLAA